MSDDVPVMATEGEYILPLSAPAHLAPATTKAPEHKVTASAAGAGFGGATSALAIGLLERHIYHGDAPGDVATWVQIVVPGVVAFIAGWLAPHTARLLRAPEETS